MDLHSSGEHLSHAVFRRLLEQTVRPSLIAGKAERSGAIRGDGTL